MLFPTTRNLTLSGDHASYCIIHVHMSMHECVCELHVHQAHACRGSQPTIRSPIWLLCKIRYYNEQPG